jgi:uncharacterized protein YegJ (DUF2314 family)
MNNHEIVYAYYTGADTPGKTSTKLRFTTPNGTKSDHIWSKDKDKYNHIYNELQEGHWHIIITVKVTDKAKGYNRWIWVQQFPCDNKYQMQAIANECGVKPSIQQFQQSIYKHLIEPRIKAAMDAAQKLLTNGDNT